MFLTEKGANRFFTKGKIGTYNPKVSLDITHLSNGFEWGGFLSNPRTELFPKGLPDWARGIVCLMKELR